MAFRKGCCFTVKRSHKNGGFGKTVLITLVISLLFGFVFDIACTQIEFAVYKRPEQYSATVEKYANEYGVPEYVVYAVMKTESDFNSSAVSGAGAVGLMQIMPDTFNWLTESKLCEYLDRGMMYDPYTNIRYGVYYLSYLFGRYRNWNTVIAAYNAGPGNVDGWLSSGEYSSDGVTLKKIPFKETRAYVKRVERASSKYKSLYYEK